MGRLERGPWRPVCRRNSGVEAGGASVMVIACMALLMLLSTAMAVAGAMVVAHRRAQAAADLAALAGAVHGCQQAAVVAHANHAELVECAPGNREALVTVQVAGPRWFGLGYDFTARARAGPEPPG